MPCLPATVEVEELPRAVADVAVLPPEVSLLAGAGGGLVDAVVAVGGRL